MAKFTGSEGEEITKQEAAAWTANYRNLHPGPRSVRWHMFGKDIIQKILAQENCIGIRMYYAIKPNNEESGEELTEANSTRQLVLVGTDADGNDLDEGVLADRSTTCPPDCGPGVSSLDG